MAKFWRDFAKTLPNGLIAYWPMSQDAGSRYDLITPGTGPAAQFVRANSEYLSIVDNADLSMGNFDFTISAWVYLDSKPGDMHILGKMTNGASANLEYGMYWVAASDQFRFFMADGSTTSNLNATTFGSPSTGAWHLVIMWYDATANTMNIHVNDGAVDSLSQTTGSQDTASPFAIGRVAGDNSGHWNGRIQNVGIWKRVLTSAERTTLYNGGAGLTFTDIGGALFDDTLSVSMVGWWNLHEIAGVRADSLAKDTFTRHDLTDNNTVTQAEGLSGNTLGNQVGSAQVGVIAGHPDQLLGVASGFVGASDQYLAMRDNVALSPGDTDFTFSGWFYWDTTGGDGSDHYIISKWIDNSNRQYGIRIANDSGDRKLAFLLFNDAGAPIGFAQDAANPTLTATWYFFVAWHDASGNTVNLQLNDNAVISNATTGAPGTTSAPFLVGIRDEAPNNRWDGRIQAIGFWNRVLTAQERTDLYNLGNGNPIFAEGSPVGVDTAKAVGAGGFMPLIPGKF